MGGANLLGGFLERLRFPRAAHPGPEHLPDPRRRRRLRKLSNACHVLRPSPTPAVPASQHNPSRGKGAQNARAAIGIGEGREIRTRPRSPRPRNPRPRSPRPRNPRPHNPRPLIAHAPSCPSVGRGRVARRIKGKHARQHRTQRRAAAVPVWFARTVLTRGESLSPISRRISRRAHLDTGEAS